MSAGRVWEKGPNFSYICDMFFLSFFLTGSEANLIIFTFDVDIEVTGLLFPMVFYLLKGIRKFANVLKLQLKPSSKVVFPS